jgi:hypothetical protein
MNQNCLLAKGEIKRRFLIGRSDYIHDKVFDKKGYCESDRKVTPFCANCSFLLAIPMVL